MRLRPNLCAGSDSTRPKASFIVPSGASIGAVPAKGNPRLLALSGNLLPAMATSWLTVIGDSIERRPGQDVGLADLDLSEIEGAHRLHEDHRAGHDGGGSLGV